MRKEEEREMNYAIGFNLIGTNHGYTNKNLVAYLESVFGKTTTLDVGYYGRVFCWFVLFKRNEKEIFEKALKIVYEDLNEYFDNGLFPMWVFEKDILIDFKDKYGGLANLYFNNDNYKKVGKNVQLVSFNTNIVVDVYDFMDCIYDHIPVFITYDLLIREGRYFFVIKKYLKYVNREYLYNLLIKIRKEYIIDRDNAKKIAELVENKLQDMYIPCTDDKEEENMKALLNNYIKDNGIKKRDDKKEKKDKQQDETVVIDTVETVSKDGKLTYEPVDSEKNKSNSNTILDNLPDYENIADYVLNKDFRIYNGVDKLTGIKKVSFFNYFQLNSLKKNIKFYRMVELAIIAILESGALKRVFKEYTKNPFFKFDIEASELKDGKVGISVLDTEVILVVEFEKNRKDVKDVKLCKSTGTIDIKEEVC